MIRIAPQFAGKPSLLSRPLLILLSLASPFVANAANPEPLPRTIEEKGIRVTFEAARVAGGEVRGDPFQEGDAVRFRFTLTDPAGKVPIRGANARAWLSLRREGEIPAAKRRK